MGALDGLREAVLLVLPTYSPATKKLVNSAFDAYEREHPGLVDIDRLKVCGTCALLTPPHMSVSTREEECPGGGRHSSCIFTPSRWRPYWSDVE